MPSRTKAPAVAVGGGLWLDRKGETLVGVKRIELLEAVERCG